MESRTLHYYLAICREGSITAAAEACHVARSNRPREYRLGVLSRRRHRIIASK